MQRSHGKIKKKKLILWRIALVKCEKIVLNTIDIIGRKWRNLAIRAGYCARSTAMTGSIIIKSIRFRRNC